MIASHLYDLIHTGNLEGTQKWLNEHPEDLNRVITDGFTALHVAAMFGHESIVQFLLDRFALVNTIAENTSGATALHLAVAFRDETAAARIAQTLIDNGAELNAKQIGGQTPLHHAVARGSAKLVDVLVMAGADPFLKDEQGRSASDLAKEMAGEDLPNEEIRSTLKKAFSLPLE